MQALSRIRFLISIALLFLNGCHAPSPQSKSKTELPINASDFHLQTALFEYTPAGSSLPQVLEFVENKLQHTEGDSILPSDVTVSVPRIEQGYTAGVDYKMLQVHLGVHGKSLRNISQDGYWVFATWLFNKNEQLEDIVITKVRPADYSE